MSKKNYTTSTYRDAAFLAECSVEKAREWLGSQPVTFSRSNGTPETPHERHILEYILLRRRDPQIDLSLAEFGRSSTVLMRVFSRSNKSIRISSCRNASLFVGESITGKMNNIDLFWRLIREGSSSELRAICENPDLSSGMYHGIMESWVGNERSKGKDAQISNDRFLQIVEFFSANPRIQVSRENSYEKYFTDGYADYQYNALFRECWELALTAPVDQDWAEALAKLYDRLFMEYAPFDEAKLWKILERWTIDGEVKYGSSFSLRQVLARRCLHPTLETLNAPDRAVRHAFYETFNPEREEFESLSWESWRERDELCEYYLIRNKNIWRSRKGRTSLKYFLRTASDYDLLNIGWFDEVESDYKKTNPDWFLDEDDEDEDEIHPGQFDTTKASEALASAIRTAHAINGAGSIDAQIQANNAVGQNVLDIDLEKFGVDEYTSYNLDQTKRDRLLAHIRQDVASAFVHSSDAFRQANKARLEARRSNMLLVIIISLLLILLFWKN